MDRLLLGGLVLALLLTPLYATQEAGAEPTLVASEQGPGDQVCQPLASGKIDVDGVGSALTVVAPVGFLIDGFCVKAGSVEQGDGPEFVAVWPPNDVVTITHSSGKDISHYSLSYQEIPPSSTTITTSTTTTTTTVGTTTTTTTEAPSTTTTSVGESTTTTTTSPPTLPATGLPTTATGLGAAALVATGAAILRRKEN